MQTPSDDVVRLDPQSVLVIAQSMSHLPAVSESAANALAPDAEYRIRQIVQDSLKFMNHSKRKRLTPYDINAALRLRNADPVYGFGPPETRTHYRSMPVSSTNPKSQRQSSRNPTAPFSAQSPTRGSRGPASSSTTAQNLTKPSDLQTGRPVTAQSNPTPVTINLIEATGTVSPSATAGQPESAVILVSANEQTPDPPSFTSVHNTPKLFFATDKELKVEDALRWPLPPIPLEVTVQSHWLAIDSRQPSISQNPAKKSDVLDGNEVEASPKPRSLKASKGPSSGKRVPMLVKPRLKHVLSRELQLYFEYLKTAIFKYDADSIERTLKSVATEHGIVQLLPYLAIFICQTVRKNMRDLPLLFSLMRLVNAITQNPVFQLDSYLHQLLPATITCLVGKRLCENPRHNHWALRDYVAMLLQRICKRYANQYVDLWQRITVTISNSLKKLNHPLTTHYGSIVACGALGSLTAKKLILPKLPVFADKVRHVLESREQSPVRRYEAAKVYCALAWALSKKRGGPDDAISVHSDDGADEEKPSIGSHIKDVDGLLPDAAKWLAKLQQEYGERVHPMGEKVFDVDVANSILDLVKAGDSNG